ncbi:MAG: ABC transporter ATP-binding protein [Acidobacteriia bacterium]|nr:ABC transporter ATP-binding protein [Terriglobia bacterium]
MTEPIVELRGVTKRYGKHVALDDFSLVVQRGEFITLLGPSGSGKTTILRLVAGFEQPQAGQVLIQGQDAAGLPPYVRDVNTVFQHFALFPHLDVFHNVAFGLDQMKLTRDEIRHRVKAILDLVELPGKEDRYPSQLSGGEKQRVALARALVLEPSVLLLDEPLGSLDEKLRKQMQVELKRLHERLKITFIFVTHDQEEALVMSDRVAVLNRGRLEQVGTGEEIYERPRTRFVAEFMGVENFFEVTLAAPAAEGCRCETRNGLTLWAAEGNGAPAGATATLAVRPEALRLSLAPLNPAAPNLLAGEVVEVIYEGGSRRWVIALSGGGRIVARDANSPGGGAGPIGTGQNVYVCWDPGRSLIFTD